MKMIKLGHTDREISQIGLGTWAIGGGPAWNGDLEVQTCVDTMVEAARCGINLIDTAPGYNFGNSELMVGKALPHLDRANTIIETKFGIVWERKGALFNKVGDTQLYKNLSAESIREEIDRSLERLGCDYVDIYMSHWQAAEPCLTPISETMGVLNELKQVGKIRAIGAANVTVEHIEEYVKYGELDIVQAKYNLLDRSVERDIIPACKKHGITLQCYSPLEQGLLTGTIARDYVPTGARANKKWFQAENLPRVCDMLNSWQPLLEKYATTTPVLALAWVLAQGGYITLLSGATAPEQVRENVAAAELELDPADVQWLREQAEALDI